MLLSDNSYILYDCDNFELSLDLNVDESATISIGTGFTPYRMPSVNVEIPISLNTIDVLIERLQDVKKFIEKNRCHDCTINNMCAKHVPL